MTRYVLSLAFTAVVALAGSSCSSDPRPPVPQKKTVAIFNLMSHPILDNSVVGIKAGLAAAGYGPDRLQIREVNANGEMDKLDAFARELMAAGADVVVPVSTPVTQAVIKVAPLTQNVVFSTVTNPSDVGMDKRPSNLTGVSDAVSYEANIDLIRELFPKARSLGIIYNAGERNSQFGVDEVRRIIKATPTLRIEVATVGSSGEVEAAARTLVDKVDVFYVGSDNAVVAALPALLKVANGAGKPVVASDSGSVEQGALAAISVDYALLGRRVGQIVADLLNTGKRAGEVENVSFRGESLLINRRAADRIGYVFPSAVVARSARTIEDE